MTLNMSARAQVETVTRFGEGGAEPYENAIRAGHGALRLVEALDTDGEMVSVVDISRFADEASEIEQDALARTSGAVLDIGCGPARIVHAAIRTGRLALGIDVSPAAVAFAQERGLPVLRRSVFQSVPSAGSWSAIVLLDGNIGIGGNPTRLLYRCLDLLAPGGEILIETHETHERESQFDAVLLGADGMRSSTFPWAEVGLTALHRFAAEAHLQVTSSWSTSGRHFSLLQRAEPTADEVSRAERAASRPVRGR